MFAIFVMLSALAHLLTVQGAVSKSDVTFRLYTRTNTNAYLLLDVENLRFYNLDVSIPFKFIIHGYYSNADVDWMQNMKDSYLKKEPSNVVLVDWRTPASLSYDVSAASTRDIGKYLGELIIGLNNANGNSYLNVHLNGHSLGAHICGFAGKHIINTQNQQIGRITAMDPAGPLFYKNPPDQRLSVGDAEFIDAIHTDGLKFGYLDPIGDVDFFPNGGVCPQPGCLAKRKRDLSDTISVSCCHSMAHSFANEAINSNSFVSKQCMNYIDYSIGLCNRNPTLIMGENVNRKARGTYYLKTNARPPYAKG